MNSGYRLPATGNYLIDTHAHFDSYPDAQQIINNAKKEDVFKMIAASFDLPSSEFSVKISQKNKGIFPSVGIHPHSAKETNAATWEKLESFAENERIFAIGETGLDYHYTKETKNEQIELFRRHIKLANYLDLPLIIHSREAFGDCFNVLISEGVPSKGFVFHAFAGDEVQAQMVVDAGGLISITGVVTFKNAEQLQGLVKNIDLENIMIETDSPYLSPDPFRGKINEPKNVVLVAKKIAELKGILIEDVAKATTSTAEIFFGI